MYRFYNVTKKEANKSYRQFNLENYKKIEHEKLIEIFETIIETNSWATEDYIIFFNNSYVVLRYKCSTVNDYNPTEQEHEFEKQIIEYYKLIDDLNS